jgi:hypothetical protein
MQPSAAGGILGGIRFFTLVYYFIFHIALKYIIYIIKVHLFLNTVTSKSKNM